mgnify:FL=1|jgi:predicted metal-binding membrane protein
MSPDPDGSAPATPAHGPPAAVTRRPATTVHLLGAACWVATIGWAVSMDMGLWGMPGTMGMSFWSFLVMWTLMMAAMMLSSMAPLALLYGRTITVHRGPRLTAFGGGYVLAWGSTGVVAFVVAGLFGDVAADRPTLARLVAVACFAAAGLYQLTPLKMRCLEHCRSPLAHLMHYLGFKGPLRDVRAGGHHGLFCLGCCWALMVLMVAFGVMNVAAMVGLALVIAVEKHWRHGGLFARAVGVVAVLWALLIVIDPGFAPGLDPDALMDMGGMDMPMDGGSGMDG